MHRDNFMDNCSEDLSVNEVKIIELTNELNYIH